LSTAGDTRRVEFRGAEYLVRAVTGSAALKAYRCPGCQQEIPPGRPHVVAWPDDLTGTDDRRHWHSGCWAAREHR